jgi:hypothetical protein
LATYWVQTVFYNTILKERQREEKERREDKEEDVSNYWTILREREDTGN